jgi:hypothetical protein
VFRQAGKGNIGLVDAPSREVPRWRQEDATERLELVLDLVQAEEVSQPAHRQARRSRLPSIRWHPRSSVAKITVARCNPDPGTYRPVLPAGAGTSEIDAASRRSPFVDFRYVQTRDDRPSRRTFLGPRCSPFAAVSHPITVARCNLHVLRQFRMGLWQPPAHIQRRLPSKCRSALTVRHPGR